MTPKRTIIASSVRPWNARGEPRRNRASAWRINDATRGSPGKYLPKRLEHRLEEVRIARAEEREVLFRIADERPEYPGHLRADQPEHDHPNPKDHAHPRVDHRRAHALQRPGRTVPRRRRRRHEGGRRRNPLGRRRF